MGPLPPEAGRRRGLSIICHKCWAGKAQGGGCHLISHLGDGALGEPLGEVSGLGLGQECHLR